MVKVDLITGFLGSGKTTFLKKYVNYLTSHGNRIAIIENDFGAINVDSMLLQDLQSDLCDIEMVIGGDEDCRRRRLKTKMISMGMLGYKRVIIEPSGIYDVEELFDILREEPLDNWYEIENVITIVDSTLDHDLSKESDYLLCNQCADAGLIVFSKSQMVDEKQIEDVKEHIQRSYDLFQCKKKVNNLFIKDWNTLTDEDYETFLHASYSFGSHLKMRITDANDYQSLFYMNQDYTKEKLVDIVNQILNDPKCGNVFRVKGFIYDQEWYQFNITKKQSDISTISNGQKVVIVIGENLNEEVINGYFRCI